MVPLIKNKGSHGMLAYAYRPYKRITRMVGLHLNFFFIILAILFQATSGILAKYASMTPSSLTIIVIMSNIYYMASLGCIFLQAIVWQQALKHYDLSFAYPFMSLVNFVILIMSYILFNEKITIFNIVSLILISIGIYIISKDI